MPHTDDTDPVQVRRAYKFRAYSTQPQEGRAVRLLADHCDLYNAALMERREAWRMRRRSVSYGMQSAQLREIRRADPDGQGLHSFTARQQTLRRLNDVYAALFQRARAAEQGGDKKPGCPQQNTVICPVHGEIDADLNGARNVFTRAGLGSGQAAAAA